MHNSHCHCKTCKLCSQEYIRCAPVTYPCTFNHSDFTALAIKHFMLKGDIDTIIDIIDIIDTLIVIPHLYPLDAPTL